MLKLEIPNESHKEMYEDVIKELEENSIEFLHPASTFTYRNGDYLDLVQRSQEISKGQVEGLVPADLYFAISQNKIFGAIQLRHNINHPNLEYRGGHIGYGIRPSERRKGHASKMLSLVLEQARKIHLEKVLITCDINNVGSNKVIQNNGGVLEKECLHEDGTRFNRYWITL